MTESIQKQCIVSKIIQDGRGVTIYDYDNDTESLRKLYHSIFMGNTVVK